MPHDEIVERYQLMDESWIALKYFTAISGLPKTNAKSTGGSNSSSSSTVNVSSLLARLAELEKSTYQSPITPLTPCLRRARSAVLSKNLYSTQWKWVPPNYYDLALPQRQKLLGAHSVHQLCKALLVENVKARDDDIVDRTYSRHYLVVIQYSTTLNAKKMEKAVRALRHTECRLDPSRFEFRVASEEDNTRLTGYEHNSVTPFGLLRGDIVPVILARSVLDVRPQFIWMGGGHVDLKLGLSVAEFVRGVDAIVADVSDARQGIE
eukprot:CAMPEP_0172499168 /NCGR_PEP_ID=MMETSP1066-20121228/123111_1 /TAXON_ID=671091 /ORGANISM="Coscinodiscus wailesii, Strain CCMP2513" /LENGTH=264 /DNA_ID=CAMNT_0013272769 /DNA_START=75 /DNA_END=869 /DNA_ORIENTATION=-